MVHPSQSLKNLNTLELQRIPKSKTKSSKTNEIDQVAKDLCLLKSDGQCSTFRTSILLDKLELHQFYKVIDNQLRQYAC